MTSRRAALLVLIVGALALLGYSGTRAVSLSFTHDESNTYDLLQGNLYWKTVANHHPLNTLLMRWGENWMGSAEWALRLPNVVAHALYLATGLLLLRRARHPVAMALGFAICNLNPFLLDFFGLARGYGLALGLSMAALWLLAHAWESAGVGRRAGFVLAALTCAALADLSNYTWLNLHLPLIGAGALILLVDADGLALRLDRRTLLAAATVVATNVAFIRNLVHRVRTLQQAGQLYARGEIGFLPDTVGSSLDCYFYGEPYPDLVTRAVFLGVVVAFPIGLLSLLDRARRERRLSFGTVLACVLGLAIAAPIVENALMGIPFPNERIALYYFPPAGMLALWALDEAVAESRRRTLRVALVTACVAVTALMTLHFARTANVTHTLTWGYDAHTKDAMREIERRFKSKAGAGQIRIGNSWIFQPSMDYYRKTLHFAWLAPIRRDDPMRLDYDVMYAQKWDIPETLGPYRVLVEYPDIGAVLLVRDRAN